MRKKINYEKVTFLGGFGGNPPRRKRFVACNCCVLIDTIVCMKQKQECENHKA